MQSLLSSAYANLTLANLAAAGNHVVNNYFTGSISAKIGTVWAAAVAAHPIAGPAGLIVGAACATVLTALLVKNSSIAKVALAATAALSAYAAYAGALVL